MPIPALLLSKGQTIRTLTGNRVVQDVWSLTYGIGTGSAFRSRTVPAFRDRNLIMWVTLDDGKVWITFSGLMKHFSLVSLCVVRADASQGVIHNGE